MIEWTALPYILLLLLATAIAASLALYAAQHRTLQSSGPFMWLCLGVVAWVATTAGEFATASLDGKVWWAKFEYLPIALTPLAWLAFALHYSGQQGRMTRRRWLLAGVLPVTTIVLIFTNEAHHLIWESVRVQAEEPFPLLVVEHGPWFWVHTVVSYSFMAAGTWLMLNHFIQVWQFYRRQGVAILLGACFPWLFSILYVLQLGPVPHLDLTPFAFTLSAVTFAWALFSFRLLDLIPVARRAVMDSMSELVIVLDYRNRVVDLNQAAAHSLGIPARAVIGQPAAQVFQAYPDMVERYDRVTALQTQITIDTATGPRDFELRIAPLGSQSRPLAGRLIVLHDITEQRHAARQIQALNTALEARVEERTAELAAAIQAKDTLLVREQAARTAAEAAQQRWTFLAEVSQHLSRSLDYPTTLTTVVTHVTPFLADWCALDLIGDDTTLQRVAARHHDPTKTALLFELERRYPLDRQGDHGFPQVARTGQPEFVPVVSADDLAVFARNAHYLDLLHQVGVCSYLSVPLIAREQPLGTLTLAQGESGRQFTPVDLDLVSALAERVALALDNARLYRTSQQAVQARDEFLSIASHELKTPLTSLQLAVQALRRALRSAGGTALETVPQLAPDYLARRLEIIEQQNHRLGKLINDLLDISRLAAGRLELEKQEVDLAALTRQVIEQFQEELALAGCPVTMHAPTPVLGCWDGTRIEQVVANLLTNAMKYGRRQPIHITVEAAGPVARLIVQDQGIGIAPEHQERIFGRFERAVRPGQYGGMGLGLYIARQIVEAHGGRITVESAPGQGATFTTELPSQVNQPG
jgi:signal transduction histidine kinase/PAS domain-containing protein